jgi:hypothetical protein
MNRSPRSDGRFISAGLNLDCFRFGRSFWDTTKEMKCSNCDGLAALGKVVGPIVGAVVGVLNGGAEVGAGLNQSGASVGGFLVLDTHFLGAEVRAAYSFGG